jgi:hypothetical protein
MTKCEQPNALGTRRGPGRPRKKPPSEKELRAAGELRRVMHEQVRSLAVRRRGGEITDEDMCRALERLVTRALAPSVDETQRATTAREKAKTLFKLHMGGKAPPGRVANTIVQLRFPGLSVNDIQAASARRSGDV